MNKCRYSSSIFRPRPCTNGRGVTRGKRISLVALALAMGFFASGHLVAEDKPAPGNPPPQLVIGKGKFVSFADGVVTLEGSLGPLGANKDRNDQIVWKNIDDKTNVYLAVGEDKGDPDRGYQKAPAVEALKAVKPGTFVFVGPWFGYQDRPGFFIGVNTVRTLGTFVSYTSGSKGSGLSLLGVDLKPSTYTKKYGNSIFIRGIPENTPVEQSTDGGPYRSIGTVKTVLADVKEGTFVTVHTHGEGNTTLIQLGLPKEKMRQSDRIGEPAK
jgi:hypothetical protein